MIVENRILAVFAKDRGAVTAKIFDCVIIRTAEYGRIFGTASNRIVTRTQTNIDRILCINIVDDIVTCAAVYRNAIGSVPNVIIVRAAVYADVVSGAAVTNRIVACASLDCTEGTAVVNGIVAAECIDCDTAAGIVNAVVIERACDYRIGLIVV